MHTKWWVGAAALAATGLVGADAYSRRFLDDTASVRYTPGNGRHLAVVFPGMMQSTQAQFEHIAPVLERYGYDIAYIVPAKELYRIETVVEVALSEIQNICMRRNVESVLLVGISMGGVAAAETGLGLSLENFPHPIDLVLDCAPIGRDSLHTPFRRVLSTLTLLPTGKLSNLLPLVRWMSVAPQEKRFEPGVNRARLMEIFEESRKTKVTRWLSELASFLRGPLFKPRLLDCFRRAWFIDAVYDDDTVDNDYAYAAWKSALDGKLERIKVHAAHVAMHEAPVAYRMAYRQIVSTE